MYGAHNKQLTFVIFDSITNSVFKSQVLDPLLRQIEEQGNLEVTLISFERHQLTPEQLVQLVPPHNLLHVVICPRTPFMGHLGLAIAGYYFARTMQSIPLEKIIARGPLAGWVVLNWLRGVHAEHDEAVQVVIQARGLGAEEYRYSHDRAPWAWYWEPLYRWYYRSLRQIELETFRQDSFKKNYGSIEIEAVSPALKNYLIEHFDADPQKIYLAQKDLIAPVAEEQRVAWRAEVRQELQIPVDAYVYCYSGSAKPWQCAEESIEFVADKMQHKPQAFLLILSTDVEIFRRIVTENKIPADRVVVIAVDPSHLLRYLAAADAGLLFREADIINWVARPTKALEYRAVGLEIIHNNTVDFIRTLE